MAPEKHANPSIDRNPRRCPAARKSLIPRQSALVAPVGNRLYRRLLTCVVWLWQTYPHSLRQVALAQNRDFPLLNVAFRDSTPGSAPVPGRSNSLTTDGPPKNTPTPAQTATPPMPHRRRREPAPVAPVGNRLYRRLLTCVVWLR